MKRIIATLLTEEQMRQDNGRDYNNAVWQRNITDYMKYQDVQFFKVDADDVFQYSRYYVVYTLPEGLRLLNKFGYSQSLSNGGFLPAHVSMYTMNEGELELLPEGKFALFTTDVYAEGKPTAINNSREARAYMTDLSRKHGNIYTKESIF